MAIDERLAARVREALMEAPALSERNMFGGVCFMIAGNMACGVSKDGLMLRVGKEAYEEVLGHPHAREMDFTGRPLTGMVYVEAAGYRTKEALADWVDRGARFAASLPPK